MTKVFNKYGVEIDFDVAVNLMDDNIREECACCAYETEQEFFDGYCEAHACAWGEPWELDTANPQY
jgi:hypothetical protein